DEKEWDLCRAREIAILDYNTGILEAKEEGEERGERKKQLEIAKKMLDLKISIDKIEKATGLTKKEIEEL
ncbi:MAG: transposase, partial [Clostridia bacterium]|nr:transposase [Clostridia bacterium]